MALAAGVSLTACVTWRYATAHEQSCPRATEGEVVLTGPQSDPYDERAMGDDTVVDADRAHWRGKDSFVVILGGGPGACLSGGRIQGDWSADTSWAEMHDTGAVIVDNPDAVVEDVRVDGYGDSLRLTENAEGFVVRRVHFSDSRDDCVENDWLHDGAVLDSLLDGCYNAFSARTYDGQGGVQDGSDHVMLVQDSLVRLKPMERTFEDEGAPGTAGFFKWEDAAPMLSLHGNVFRADQPAGTVGLDIPEDRLADCSDNVMVWLGGGDYPGELPSCFELTRDEGVWDRAVADWKRDHDR